MISIRGVHRGRGIFFGAGTKDVHINNSIIPEITIRSLNVCKTHKTHTTLQKRNIFGTPVKQKCMDISKKCMDLHTSLRPRPSKRVTLFMNGTIAELFKLFKYQNYRINSAKKNYLCKSNGLQFIEKNV